MLYYANKYRATCFNLFRLSVRPKYLLNIQYCFDIIIYIYYGFVFIVMHIYFEYRTIPNSIYSQIKPFLFCSVECFYFWYTVVSDLISNKWSISHRSCGVEFLGKIPKKNQNTIIGFLISEIT